MIIPPFYSVPTLEELIHHYDTVAQAIGIPIMVYNNPATSNVDMTPAMLAEISRIPNCRYVKESTLEATRVRDIIALCGDRMEVFAGVLGYESAWLGAIGWVAVCSNVAPRLSSEMFDAAAFEANRDKALPLYRKLAPLLPWVGGPRYVSGTKAAFRLMGMDMGPPRPPRLPLPGKDLPALAQVLQGIGLTHVAAQHKLRLRIDLEPQDAPPAAVEIGRQLGCGTPPDVTSLIDAQRNPRLCSSWQNCCPWLESTTPLTPLA
jgi:4-hydroxy-tetrahydrodipicolinate synthase